MANEPKRFANGVVLKNLSDGPNPTDTNPTCNIPGHAWVIDTNTTQTAVVTCIANACDLFTKAAHGLTNGQHVKVTTVACAIVTSPANLLDACDKAFVICSAACTFKLSLTSGGSAIAITNCAGSVTLTVIEEHIRAYLCAVVEQVVTDTNTVTMTNKTLCSPTLNCVTFGGTSTFEDDAFEIIDTSDATKKMVFDITGSTSVTGTLKTTFTTAKTVTIPNATDTLVGKATTDTLTNKTLGDTNTINAQDDAFTIDCAACATKQIDFAAGGTACTKTTISAAQTTNKTITLPNATDTLVGKATTDTLTNKTLGDTNTINAQDDAFEIQCAAAASKKINFAAGGTACTTTTISAAQSANRTITLPNATDTLVGKATTDTLTNKTLCAAVIKPSCATTWTIPVATDTSVGKATTDTLTNKTLGDTNTINAQDDAFTINDASDATLQIDFNAAGTTCTKTTITSSQTANRIITLPDAADTLVGKATTDTLTNKTLTDPQIGAAIVFCQIATPSNPSACDLKLYAKTSKTLFILDACGAETEVGAGGGSLDIFYSETFEATVAACFTSGNNATFDNGGCLNGTKACASACTELAGTNSLQYTMSCASTNDWIASPTIAIDDKQSGNMVGIQGYYTYNGADDDIKFVVFDDTGNTVLTQATDFVKAICNPQRFSIQVLVPSTSTNLKWGFQVVTGNCGKIFRVDDVEITTNPFVNADTQDENVFSARIANGGSATITSQSGTNEINENAIASVCRTAAGFVTVTFTSGFFSVIPSISSNLEASGTFVSIHTISTTSFVAEARTHLGGAQDSDFDFIIQRQGSDFRQVTENIVAYNSRNASNLVIRGEGNGGTALTANVTNVDFTEVTDTGFGCANWDGTVFTAPADGLYYVTGAVHFTGAALNSIAAYIDGVIDITIGRPAASNIIWFFNGGFNLTQGQALSFRIDGNLTLVNCASTHHISITKVGVGDLLGVPKPIIGYLKDVKGSSVGGGTFCSGAYRTRNLNTTEGCFTKFGTLACCAFTLNAGTYHIEATAPAHDVDQHVIKLRNTTDCTDTIIGAQLKVTSTQNDQNFSKLVGSVSITTTKTFEIQHRATTTKAGGFGDPITFDSNVYTMVTITKTN